MGFVTICEQDRARLPVMKIDWQSGLITGLCSMFSAPRSLLHVHSMPSGRAMDGMSVVTADLRSGTGEQQLGADYSIGTRDAWGI